MDYCILDRPTSVTVDGGDVVRVYGRVLGRMTDLSNGVDVDELILAQVGIGPNGVSQRLWTG